MSQIASALMCWSTSLLKQTSLTVFFFVFLSFSLTLPLYYSMSTVAMETILLFLSSLLVCVAGKCPPAHETHTHRHTHVHAYKRTCVHTLIVHREAVSGQDVMLHEKALTGCGLVAKHQLLL